MALVELPGDLEPPLASAAPTRQNSAMTASDLFPLVAIAAALAVLGPFFTVLMMDLVKGRVDRRIDALEERIRKRIEHVDGPAHRRSA